MNASQFSKRFSKNIITKTSQMFFSLTIRLAEIPTPPFRPETARFRESFPASRFRSIFSCFCGFPWIFANRRCFAFRGSLQNRCNFLRFFFFFFFFTRTESSTRQARSASHAREGPPPLRSPDANTPVLQANFAGSNFREFRFQTLPLGTNFR